MFSPYELEGKVFKKVMKGYNTAEVDEHIEFLLDKYKELYRAYKELEKKYSGVRAELLTYKENEDSIRQTLESSRTTGAQLMRDAEDRSEIILKTAKEECDAVIADFKRQIQEQMDVYDKMKAKVAAFKEGIFEQYQQHIEYLESISADASDADRPEPDDVKSETIGKIVIKANRRIADRNEENTVIGPRVKADDTDSTDTDEKDEPSEMPETDVTDLHVDSESGESESPAAGEPTEEAAVADENSENGENGEKDDGEHSGDTMEYPVINDNYTEINKAEDIIFGDK